MTYRLSSDKQPDIKADNFIKKFIAEIKNIAKAKKPEIKIIKTSE